MPGMYYELLSVKLNDIIMFNGLVQDNIGFYIELDYDHARLFETVRKRNTLLFEQLNKFYGLKTKANSDTIKDFLYEIIIVDLNWNSRAGLPFYKDKDGKIQTISTDQLKELLYYEGIRIRNIPKTSLLEKKTGFDFPSNGSNANVDETGYNNYKILNEYEDITIYKPFVSSASMARKGQYLYIREKYMGEIMERLSLGIVSTKNKHFVMKGLRDSTEICVSKLEAYLGLTLSDGQTMEELLIDYANKYSQETAKEVRFPLNADSVVCVSSCKDFVLPLNKLGSYVWKTKNWKTQVLTTGDILLGEQKKNILDVLESNIKNCSLQKYIICLQDGGADSDAYEKESVDKWNKLLKMVLENKLPLSTGEEIEIPTVAEDSLSEELILQWIISAGFAYAYKRGCKTGYLSSVLCKEVTVREGEFLTLSRREFISFLDACFHDLFDADVNKKNEARNTLLKAIKEREGRFLTINLISPEKISLRYMSPCKHLGAVLARPNKKDKYAELYDGVGFCDEDTFNKIERLLLCKKEATGRYNALVIRLPFMKGLLVRFNFLDFITDRIKDKQETSKSIGSPRIQDMFGIERDLFYENGDPKIRILVTESMFKAGKIFKEYLIDMVENDPWKEYWRRVDENGFSLLVTQHNSPPRSKSRLNYQFLSTLGMSKSQESKLIKAMFEKLERNLQDPLHLAFTQNTDNVEEMDYTQDVLMLDEQADEELSEEVSKQRDKDNIYEEVELQFFPEEDDISPTSKEKILENISSNGILNSKYINNLIYDVTWNSIRDAMVGRIEVQGEVRYIVPDLMAMIEYITDCFVLKKNRPLISSPINGLEKKEGKIQVRILFGHGYYYAPGEKTPWRRKDGTLKKVCLLRNPHFAVGEDALLAPLPSEYEERYNKWFQNLTGVVFAPGSAMLTINGADSDGDLGNVCCERSVIDAAENMINRNVSLLRLVVEKKQEILDELERLRREELNKGKRDGIDRYFGELSKWVIESIPNIDEDEFIFFKKGYAPAIIYAGSGTVQVKNNPKSLNTLVDVAVGCKASFLEERLWEVFQLTTEASIGIKSIEALRYSVIAYANSLPESPSLKEICAAWLSHYRVVNCGLDTANAIDSAKTNTKFESISMASWKKKDLEMMGIIRGDTPFTKFRQSLARKSYLLKRTGMHQEFFKDLCEDAYKDIAKDQIMAGIDYLPRIVFDNNIYKGKRYRFVREEDEVKELRTFFVCKDEDEISYNCQREILEKTKDILKKYIEGINSRRRMRTNRPQLRKYYGQVLRLLMEMFPMEIAFDKACLLLGNGTFDNCCFGNLPIDINRNHWLKHIDSILKDDILLSRLVFSESNARKALLKEYLPSFADEKFLSEEAMNLFTFSEQGIYVLKATIRYLRELVENTSCEAPEATISTPVDLIRQLREDVKVILGKYIPASDIGKELINRSLCNCLVKLEQKGKLSDFLFLDLMGEYLPIYYDSEGTE
ncbi:MAG: hypothetical protein IJ899_08125 [Blautia sp.]|nr:hypothetical protein [Blautia sp.]